MQAHTVKLSGCPTDPPRLPLTAASMHPTHQPVVDEVVHLQKFPCARPRTTVVSPSAKYGIQFGDDLLHVLPAVPRIRDLAHAIPETLHGLGRWPAIHKVPSRIPQNTALLADRTSQEYEAPLPPPQIHHPRLLPVQRQPQFPHHKLNLSTRRLRLRFRGRHHTE